MAIFKYTVEGIYETDKGSGKDFTPFKFEIDLPRFEGAENGAGTHILRRFLPLLIKQQKNKPLLSKIKSWYISDISKISDEFLVVGKDIKEMSEDHIQKLACLYDLFEVPLPLTTSITNLREKAAQAYMKEVLKVKMETNADKAKLSCFKLQTNGSYKFVFGDEKYIVELVHVSKPKSEVKKMTFSELMKQAQEANQNIVPENGIISVVEKVGNDNSDNDGKGQPEGNSGFPSANDLINN